jgi:tetratricopeptide (TPR) repeat protein
MRMHLESENREAFELVTDALEYIDQYRASRNFAVLASAQTKLLSALEKDPGYFRACYFNAIVDDLVGRSQKAASTFQKLVEEQPPFIDEVRYNLGVAEYHQYNHAALDRAIAHFSSLIATTLDVSLQYLARAGLAQAHAMHMIPQTHDEPQLTQIEKHFTSSLEASSYVLKQLGRWFWKPSVRKLPATEIKWAAHNARGMALMYHTDYFPSVDSSNWQSVRIKELRDATRELEIADQFSPKNWANYCDIASAQMRLAYYEESSVLYQKAATYLQEVLTRLRPGYAFAMYELGRIHRLQGHFDAAARLFRDVMAIPVEERDISDRRPKKELERTMIRDLSFP